MIDRTYTKNKTLLRLKALLEGLGATKVMFVKSYRPTLRWSDRDGNGEALASPCGKMVDLSAVVPLEGAAIATLGPTDSLLDSYPASTSVIDFGGMPMRVAHDDKSYVLDSGQVDRLQQHCKRLNLKVTSQRRTLRRLHAKQLQMMGEMLRMERNAQAMLIRESGYAEGE